MEDLTGKQFGPYRIVAPLGEGGMAAVYRAYQASMDRNVALKVLPQYLARDPQFVGRFKQEAMVLALLALLWSGEDSRSLAVREGPHHRPRSPDSNRLRRPCLTGKRQLRSRLSRHRSRQRRPSPVLLR